jgi:TP901 family phage tail tape measure protein
MAQGFVLDVNLRIQQVLGLDKAKQQLANIQVGGVGQVQQLSSELKGIGTNLATATAQINQNATAIGKLGQRAQKTGGQLGKASKSAQSFGDQIFLAGKRYAAFLGATVGAFKAFQLIQSGTKSVIEFDKSMVSLSQIIGTSVDDLGDLSQQFLDLSVATGTSAAEIANAAKLLAQAGFRGGELTEAVEQLSKVPLTPIFENMDQAVDGAIASMRQFSDEGLTVETVFDKMIKVSNNYAASFPEIIEGLKRGGSAFQAIGGTLDEFIAAFTTIRSVTRESASAVGTSLKTISSRLADPKILKFLETKGIRLIEQGQFVEPLEALRRIGEGLENTRNLQDKVNIAVRLGGRRQVSRFLALAQNFEKTNEILGVSKDSFGEFGKVAEQGLEAVSVQIDIMVAKAKKLAIDLGEDIFLPMINGLTGAATAAIGLADALSPIIGIVAQIGVAFAGATLLKGIGRFAGPQLAKLAGPAAFAAAGGGFKGIGAGIGASPFLQAGLLVAASEAAAALLETADGAESFTGTLITSVASITAAVTLFKAQTVAQFAAGGGIFSSLGKLGKLGGLAGSLATVGAVAVPLAIADANNSAKELADKIVNSAVQSIAEIEIDTADPQSVSNGLNNLYQKIGESVQSLIKSADVRDDPSISKTFQGIGRALSNVLEGDFEALIRRGGLTQANVEANIQKIIKESPQAIQDLIDGVANSLVVSGRIDQPPRPTSRRGITISTERSELVGAGISGGLGVQKANELADAVIESVGGIEEWTDRVKQSADQIQKEAIARAKITRLTKNFIPNRLVGQLLQFSKAVNRTTQTINASSRLFETQIAEITGGISQPTFDFDFGPQQVKGLISSGGLKDLFALSPDIPGFVSTFQDIEKLVDNFIINVSNLPVGDLSIEDEIDKFFDFQKNVPPVIRENLEDFLNTVALDVTKIAEGDFVDTEGIKERFRKEFEGLGVGATDAVVESVTGFMQATFAQIEDELNRLATVRRLELDVPVGARSQAEFLQQQLRRVGISAGGNIPTNERRGTLEELDLLRREREARGGVTTVPGFIPTPRTGFFQGRDQGLVDIAGDERIRQQVRDSFREIIIESTALKKKLSELKPGAEGFIAASNRAKELARSTIELQTTLEALDRATQQALESEKRTLLLRQQLETSQTEARLAERVRVGALEPLGAERILFDLAQEQAKEQDALQDKYNAIIEKDNSLRVNLAQQISDSTKTQAEVVDAFSASTNIFANATQSQVTSIDLMGQYIVDFGQAVVDFKNFNSANQSITQGVTADVTPAQIRSGGTTIQQGYDELNRIMNDTNTTQEQELEILRAILERQSQVQQVEQKSSTTQKEQERDTETSERIGKLSESLDRLSGLLGSPSEVKIVSDQRIEMDLSTLPADVSDEIRPLLEEASKIAATTIVRKAFENMASKSDSEVSIAATNTAQELV